MKDWKGMAHVKWEYTHHILFILKYRKKKLHGGVKKVPGNIS